MTCSALAGHQKQLDMAGNMDDIVFCINGSEYCLKRDSDLIRDSSLNDFIRRKTPFKVRTRIRHHHVCGVPLSRSLSKHHIFVV